MHQKAVCRTMPIRGCRTLDCAARVMQQAVKGGDGTRKELQAGRWLGGRDVFLTVWSKLGHSL